MSFELLNGASPAIESIGMSGRCGALVAFERAPGLKPFSAAILDKTTLTLLTKVARTCA